MKNFDTLYEINLAYCNEAQMQLYDIDRRMTEQETLIANANSSNNAINETAIHVGNALKRHNNTIKTHLKLNDAYNMDVMSKINDSIKNVSQFKKCTPITKEQIPMNQNVSQPTYTEITRNENHLNAGMDAIGEIAIKPLNFQQRYTKQTKVFVNNVPPGKQEIDIRAYIASILNQVAPKSKPAIFTNKITFDNKTHDVKHAVFIINTPDIIDIAELNKTIAYFLEVNAKKRNNA